MYAFQDYTQKLISKIYIIFATKIFKAKIA
jgi:hypothetical protein